MQIQQRLFERVWKVLLKRSLIHFTRTVVVIVLLWCPFFDWHLPGPTALDLKTSRQREASSSCGGRSLKVSFSLKVGWLPLANAVFFVRTACVWSWRHTCTHTPVQVQNTWWDQEGHAMQLGLLPQVIIKTHWMYIVKVVTFSTSK